MFPNANIWLWATGRYPARWYKLSAKVKSRVNGKRMLVAQFIASAFIGAFPTTGCGTLGTAERGSNFPVERAQIERRLQEVLVAAEHKDFNRLESYHLYGPKFTKFTGSSPARLDAAASRKGERDGLVSLQGLKMRTDSLRIDVFGNVGIATFILDYSFDSGGQIVRRKDRTTLVFVQESGTWKIVHEHLSPITMAEP